MGRRLWRRRRRRAGDESHPPHEADDAPEPADDHRYDTLAGGPAGVGEAVGTSATPKPGFFARLFGRKPVEPPPYLVEDPVREVMLLPRGARRLDAFEARLKEADPAQPGSRRLALAFHAELLELAQSAGVELSLYESRVTACAQALIAAGEEEKAGDLYARLGRKHQAAELFVRAGAIDALEEAHAELSFEEGGSRLEARLAFERFEALYLVDLRDDAIAALERAVQLWEHPAYMEVLAGVRARLPVAHGVTLTQGDAQLRVRTRFPLVLGRAEDSAVRIDSPLVSRAHVDIQRREGALVLRDLVSSGGTRVDDVVIDGPTALSASGTIDLAGVIIDYAVDGGVLRLASRLRAEQATLVPVDGTVGRASVDHPVLGCAIVLGDGVARVVADGRATVNGEVLRRDLRLLIGDRVQAGGRTWTVAG